MMPKTPFRTILLATVLAMASVAPTGAQDAGSAAVPLSDENRQDQLDRIEAKLDALLQRLGDGSNAAPDPSATRAAGQDTAASTPGVATDAAGPASAAASKTPPSPAEESDEAESYTPGAIAVAHAAPGKGQALSEIPADSIGGFVYTGGPIQLDDLAGRGVRYAGPAGIELQGWLRATQAGRHQIAADLQVRFGTGTISALPCTFSAWLEGQAIGAETREADPWGAKGEPVPLSLVLGAELEPGLYRLRLWIACADLPTARDGQSVQAEVLVKGPGDMNLRPVTGEDVLHKG